MSGIQDLIDRHRGDGILVDSNLLVLYLVGKVNRRRITQFKRTRSFRVEDFEILDGILAQFHTKLTTPGIWAEVSNLTDLQGTELRAIRQLIQKKLQLVTEHYTPSSELAGTPAFHRLGITDAAIVKLNERPMLALTADLQLYVWLLDRGVDAYNFNHIRVGNP